MTSPFRDGVNKSPGYDKPGNTCTTCYGYGLWGIGEPAPMGSMDAEDGMPTIACPECGENPNEAEVFRPPKSYESSIILPGSVEEAHEKIAELQRQIDELKERVDG